MKYKLMKGKKEKGFLYLNKTSKIIKLVVIDYKTEKLEDKFEDLAMLLGQEYRLVRCG